MFVLFKENSMNHYKRWRDLILGVSTLHTCAWPLDVWKSCRWTYEMHLLRAYFSCSNLHLKCNVGRDHILLIFDWASGHWGKDLTFIGSHWLLSPWFHLPPKTYKINVQCASSLHINFNKSKRSLIQTCTIRLGILEWVVVVELYLSCS